jgi:hypothetical protein
MNPSRNNIWADLAARGDSDRMDTSNSNRPRSSGAMSAGAQWRNIVEDEDLDAVASSMFTGASVRSQQGLQPRGCEAYLSKLVGNGNRKRKYEQDNTATDGGVKGQSEKGKNSVGGGGGKDSKMDEDRLKLKVRQRPAVVAVAPAAATSIMTKVPNQQAVVPLNIRNGGKAYHPPPGSSNSKLLIQGRASATPSTSTSNFRQEKAPAGVTPTITASFNETWSRFLSDSDLSSGGLSDESKQYAKTNQIKRRQTKRQRRVEHQKRIERAGTTFIANNGLAGVKMEDVDDAIPSKMRKIDGNVIKTEEPKEKDGNVS